MACTAILLLAAPVASQDLPDADSQSAASLAAALARARAASNPSAAIAEYRRAQGLLGAQLLYGGSAGHRPDAAASAAIHRGLARAYLDLGDAYAAAVEATQGVNLADGDAALWTLLGIAQYRLAELDAAAVAFARAEALDPEAEGLPWGQALMAVARNDLVGARAHGARAFAREPDAGIALGLAQWAAVAGDYPGAASALGRYLALARDDPQAAAVRQLQRFYTAIGRAPVNQVDPRTTRAQLNFDLKPGDEIPYVAVRLNGAAPVYVLLDTGAERNVLDAAYARSIGVGPIFPGGALHGAYRATPAGQALLDSLQLGSLTVRRVPFAVGDFAALNLRGQGDYFLAGVINPALVLRDFLVVLDYGHRRIELVRYGAGGEAYAQRPSRLRKTALPFAFDANGVWPVIGVSFDGGRPLPLLADTGASDILIGRATAGALRLDPRDFAAAAGGFGRENLRAILLDAPPAAPGGISVQGILGFPFFRGMRVAFDYRAMTMVLEN